MAILKRTQIEDRSGDTKDSIYGDEELNYISIKKWLMCIYRVKDVDTKEEWIVDSDAKMIYSYLRNYGVCYGYNSIYPNQDLMAMELGLKLRTLQRKLKLLGECGLIDIIKTKNSKGKWYSNRYRVKTPNFCYRRLWYNINGEQLKGKEYVAKRGR